MPNFARGLRVYGCVTVLVSTGWFLVMLSSTSSNVLRVFLTWLMWFMSATLVLFQTVKYPERQINTWVAEAVLARRRLAMLLGWVVILFAGGLLLTVVLLDPLDDPHDLIKFMIGCPLLIIIAMVSMGAYDQLCDRIKRALLASGN